jgi:hypothetical protein
MPEQLAGSVGVSKDSLLASDQSPSEGRRRPDQGQDDVTDFVGETSADLSRLRGSAVYRSLEGNGIVIQRPHPVSAVPRFHRLIWVELPPHCPSPFYVSSF